MLDFLEELVGLVVWLLAVAVYVDARRKGLRGFRRLVSFWMGFPATWLSFLVVSEGSQPLLAPPPDDEDALLEEIRRDRALEPGPGGREHTPEDS
jgi:hypothetical protein